MGEHLRAARAESWAPVPIRNGSLGLSLRGRLRSKRGDRVCPRRLSARLPSSSPPCHLVDQAALLKLYVCGNLLGIV